MLTKQMQLFSTNYHVKKASLKVSVSWLLLSTVVCLALLFYMPSLLKESNLGGWIIENPQ